jgi:PAS domain S-box-containing protein
LTADEFNGLDFAKVMEDLAAPAYVIDKDGRFRWLNRACIETFGDLRGRSFVDHVVPEHRQRGRTNFARKVVGNSTTVFDIDVFDRAGERITIRVTSAPLRREGEVVGVFGLAVPVAQAVVPSGSALDELTPRQQEVLRLLAEGLETPEIAKRLGVADETARNHIRALLRATGAHSRLEVVLMGMRHGLVSPDIGPAADD